MLQNCGLYPLHGTWKSEDHQLVEIRYPLANRLFLINTACKPAVAAECALYKTLVAGLSPGSMESMFVISVENVCDHRRACKSATLNMECSRVHVFR